MFDLRWQQLAEVLVCYSTATQPGERVLITMLEADTLPLVRGVYAVAVKSGAYPFIEFQSAYLERDLMWYGNNAQIGWVSEMSAYGMDWAHVNIAVRGVRNPYEFDDIAPDKIALHRKSLGEISKLRTEKTRWVIVTVPNEAFAQQAGMSLDQAMSMFFGATLCDWATEGERYRAIQQRFQSGETVRIVGEGTDLTLSTKGRKYHVDDGHINMPGGEVYTAPVEDSAEGHIYFEHPGVLAGQFVHGIRLSFSQGLVVEATAESNQDFLLNVLDTDAGSRRIGEFAIGTNPGITRFCNNIFYDEKIAGTVHIGLGRSYASCGGVNQSAIHWDIIKDLRQNGQIFLDGRLIFENGRFIG